MFKNMIKNLGKNIGKDKPKLKLDVAYEEFNILVIGETQAGKSTLIQSMMKYADPAFKIDTSALGTGFTSHTVETKINEIITALPEHYVEVGDEDITTEHDGNVKVTYEKGTTFNYGEFIKFPSPDDYMDTLNLRKGLEVKVGNTLLEKKVKFNLIDTPGLNATDGLDEKNIQRVFGALKENKTIHMVLLVVGSVPFTPGFQDAIKAYVDMFPGFNGIITVVHTHAPYKNLHPESRTKLSSVIATKKTSLNKILGRDTIPHVTIDCDVYNKKPVLDCITWNTIQKILELATLNHPVDMLHTVINKTRKMRDVDNILRDKFEATSVTIEKTLLFKDKVEGQMLVKIFKNDTDIYKLESQIKVLDEFLVRHDDDNQFEVLHEERRDMDYEGDEAITIRYPKAGKLNVDIHKLDLHRRNVEVLSEGYNEVEGFWEGKFRKTSPQNSVLHIKIYATKSKLYKNEIILKRQEREDLSGKLQVAIVTRDTNLQQNSSKMEAIKEIVDNHGEGVRILGFAMNDVITQKVFNELMEAKAYIGDAVECSLKVQNVYKKLANMPKEA